MALAAALEEIERLKKLKADERFTPTDTAENVATAMVGMFTPTRLRTSPAGRSPSSSNAGSPNPARPPNPHG